MGSAANVTTLRVATAAAQQPVPASVQLKDPKDFKFIGKHVPRKDSVAKTDGTAKFTQDVFLPGMLTAVVAHPPRFGATVKSFDASKARAVKGVVDVVRIPSGVAVLARDTGLRERRIIQIAAGASLIEATLDWYRLDHLEASGSSLREGAILATSRVGTRWREELVGLVSEA